METDRQAKPATAFERVQLARHPDRPYTLDFFERLFEDFVEIHGDRRYADDPALAVVLLGGATRIAAKCSCSEHDGAMVAN